MAHQPFPGAFVIGAHAVAPHPVLHGGAQPGGGGALQQAVRHVHHLMAVLPVKADLRPRRGRELGLVAVARGTPGAQDGLHPDRSAADAAQGVFHPRPLGLKLFRIVHMPEAAAAALGIVGTVGGNAGRRRREDRFHPPPESAAAHVGELHLADFPSEGAGNEDHHALQTAHAAAVAGVAVNGQRERVPLLRTLIHGRSHPPADRKGSLPPRGCAGRAGRRPGARRCSPPP